MRSHLFTQAFPVVTASAYCEEPTAGPTTVPTAVVWQPFAVCCWSACTFLGCHSPRRWCSRYGLLEALLRACCVAMPSHTLGLAAGLTAGAHAAAGNTRTLILEGNAEAGRKILVSGGTRCNVCPGSLDQQRDFITESSQSALRAILKSWNLSSCLAWYAFSSCTVLAVHSCSRDSNCLLGLKA